MKSTVILLVLLLHVHANPSNPSHGSCTPPPRGTNPPPPIHSLLPSNVFRNFQQGHHHIPRESLPNWSNLKSNLTPTLPNILSRNITTPGDGPLRLNYDITLHKLTDNGRTTVEKISGSGMVPPSITSALDDGFSLTLHRMDHRKASVHTLVASLTQAFGVRVSAEFTIHPGDASCVFAQDVLLMVLSGTCVGEIREAVVKHPFEEDLQGIGNGSVVRVSLAEGDMLYLPRGEGLAVSGVSLLVIKLHTDEMTIVQVLHVVIDVASAVNDSPIARSLPGSEGEYSYADLLKELVNIGARVTDDLRKHFVVGEDMHGDEDDESVDVVSEVTGRFFGAVHALLEPGMEVLAERDGVGRWVKGLSEAEREMLVDEFEECVEWLKERDLVDETVAEVFASWFERREGEEGLESELRLKGLSRHGESTEWIPFD